MIITALSVILLSITVINIILPLVFMIKDGEIAPYLPSFAGWLTALLFEVLYYS